MSLCDLFKNIVSFVVSLPKHIMANQKEEKYAPYKTKHIAQFKVVKTTFLSTLEPWYCQI